MPNILKQNFSFLFEEGIWKIIFDTSLPLIAVELRDINSKKVWIEFINYQTFKLLPSATINIDWWSSLSAVDNGNIIIQKYKDNKFPETKGFQCFNIFEEKLLINESESSFAFFSGQHIIAATTHFDQVFYEEFSFDEILKKQPLNNEVIHTLAKASHHNILTPIQYYASNNHFNTVKAFIYKIVGKDAISCIEYVETTSVVVVSYYIRGFEHLENYLLVTDLTGDILMDQLINSTHQGTGKDTFLIKEDQLIFIKNKKEIQSYAI